MAGSLSSRAARCLMRRPLDSVRLPWGRLVLSVCLLAVSAPAGGGVAVGMAGRGCFSSVSRVSCGLPLRVKLLLLRLVSSFASLPQCACLAAGVSFLRCGSCPDTHFAPSHLLRGGAFFFFLCGLLIDEECGHVAGHDAGHGVCRIVRPILDLVAGRLGIHEVIGRGDKLVVHTVDGLADCSTDTTDIDELGGALDDLVKSGLVGIATVVLCEDVSDLDVLDVLHCVVLSSVPFRHL